MVRPTIGNFIIVTIMAVLGIYGARFATRLFPIPGISDIVGGI